MEPFVVTCETCRARLKVRDERVLGQIHECPKCGSMVQIAAPASVAAVSAAVASVKSAPLRQAAVEPLAAEASDPMAAASGPDLAGRFGHIAREQSWMFLAGGMSLIVVIGLVTAVMRSSPNNTDVNEYPSALQTDVVPSEVPIEVPSVASSREPTVAAMHVSPAVEPPARDANELLDTAIGDAPLIPSAPPISPAATLSPTAMSATENQSSPTTSSGVRTLTLEPIAVVTEPALRVNVLIPSNTSDATYSAAEPDVSNEPSQERAPIAPVANRERAQDSAKIATQMALPIKSIDFPKTSLGEFARIISEMGAVSVGLDAQSLAAAGATTRTTVAVQARDTTLGEVLSEALEPLGLAWVELEGKIIVLRAAK